jgi:hypothetical protein
LKHVGEDLIKIAIQACCGIQVDVGGRQECIIGKYFIPRSGIVTNIPVQEAKKNKNVLNVIKALATLFCHRPKGKRISAGCNLWKILRKAQRYGRGLMTSILTLLGSPKPYLGDSNRKEALSYASLVRGQQ